jgi:predicted GNAT family acetyltransferase
MSLLGNPHYTNRISQLSLGMDIKQIDRGSKGAFVIEVDNERLAEMTYSKTGDKLIIIDHTDVSDKLRGQGAGKQLVMKAVEYARANDTKILPLSPFARSVFDKTPEIADVLN